MAAKQNLKLQCPWCSCQVVVKDYRNRYPDSLCICRKSQCLAKEAHYLEAWYQAHRQEYLPTQEA